MPRRPRVASDTGIYHVMVRGINRMAIFKTSGEKEKYLDALAQMKEEGEYSLYGYCIMDNHAHLLIKEEEDTIDRIMKRIGVSYVYYYNKKYERIGSLFQGRYRSERVESEDYLLACLRYIHNNPVKANVTATPAAYRWSSYNSYISRYLKAEDIISRDFILDIISEDRPKAIKQLIEYTKLHDNLVFLDNDDEAEEMQNPYAAVENILNQHNLSPEDLGILRDKKLRNIVVRRLKKETNISIGELSKIIGISKATISRII